MTDWIKESNLTSSSRLICSHCREVMESVLFVVKSIPVVVWCVVAPYGLLFLFQLVTISPKITAVRVSLYGLINILLHIGVVQLFFLLVQVLYESLLSGFITIPNLAPIQLLLFMIFLSGCHLKNKYLQDSRNTLIQWNNVAIHWWIDFVTGSLWNIFFPFEIFLDKVKQLQDNTQHFDFHIFGTLDHRIGNGYILSLTDALKKHYTKVSESQL